MHGLCAQSGGLCFSETTEHVGLVSKGSALCSIHPLPISPGPSVMLIGTFPDFPRYLQTSARKLLM